MPGASLGSRGLLGGPAGIATAGLLGGAGGVAPTGMTVLDARLGLDQGRVRPSSMAPTAGSWAMLLGSDQVGHAGVLRPGDFVEVYQDVDVTGDDLFRLDLRFRVPMDTPDGRRWRVSLLVDDAAVASTVGRPGQTRVIGDLAADVSKLTGTHKIAIRLGLEAS